VSWSQGADDVVYKPSVKTANDIDVYAAQAYGPHTDWVIKTILDARKKPNQDVKIRWTKNLVGLTENTPAAAFREDDTVDAAFMIYPDAVALVPGAGAGGEDAYKGARIDFSTKTANHVIADVIYVRKDFYEANKERIKAFQNAYFRSAEELGNFMKNKSAPEYQDGIKKLSLLLLDSDGPDSVANTEGMYSGANIVGWKGNVSFFADRNDPRNFTTIWNESQSALLSLGLIKNPHDAPIVEYNYKELKVGLTDTSGVVVPAVDFVKAKSILAQREQAGTLDKGGVFRPFAVSFLPNQIVFPEKEYAEDFDRAINAAKTYGGAIITIEGHVDPYKYLRRKSEGGSEVELGQITQSGKNTSMVRAIALRDALIKYAAARKIIIDPNTIQVVGHGFRFPIVANPTKQAEQLQNMRAEVRINVVESEELLPN
jgi:outer membrane protein OmpA-like peptidoglycan-associated protein